jgi:hypothetical protein
LFFRLVESFKTDQRAGIKKYFKQRIVIGDEFHVRYGNKTSVFSLDDFKETEISKSKNGKKKKKKR